VSTALTSVGYRHIVSLADAWERNAGEWIAWARAPGHDGFWESTWPALREVLPAPGGTVLDLGCGEGRLGRLLQAAGFRVIGIDRSPALTRAAAAASPAFPVAVADAAALPLASESISLVVASMSLHDIDDLTGAIHEASRVLEPGGQFCITIVHPFVTAQDDDTLHTDQFRVSRPYLRLRRYEDHVERDGLSMTFTSVHRPLSAYTEALSENELAITTLREYGDRAVPWRLTATVTATAAATG
jgi:ubiquinone/menaquinone biosynthesis C-methylase UbiE